jgi:5-methylcytosine-specific restriction endonuclease McrBC regulatory subunit McrC
MVLVRMNALLDTLDRRFEVVAEDRAAPRGRIDWASYATTRLPRARVLAIPCSFPDLRDDRQLKGAVRFAVEKQIRSLETQVEHGAFVHRLLALGRQVLRRVQSIPVHIPSRGTVDAWLQRPMRAQHFLDGIQGIQWTAEDRGLAGVSDLDGIPWRMPMDEFFEAWVETVLAQVAQKTGGRLCAGRKRETVHAVNWQPPFTGSQRALVPDFTIEYNDLTLIVDAKYKRHLEELQQHSWTRVEAELREQHRHDLLQVLAYANLATTPNVIACLAYPCSATSWESLQERGRLHHYAEIAVGSRTIRLWLTAVPMAMSVGEVSESLLAEVRRLLDH